jgi:hypothetical protein
MDVESLAFKYVEMVLNSLLAKKAVPTVGPGIPVRIKDSVQVPGMQDKIVMCISPENSDGKCQVMTRSGKTMWIERGGIQSREEEISGAACNRGCNGDGQEASDSCKNKCGTKESCCATAGRSKDALASALEASADKVIKACIVVRDAAAADLPALQTQMLAAKKEFKAILTESKQVLEGDSRLSKLSLNGPCSNELCLCAICECGVTCRCNVSADVKDSDTCEKCVDFRAEKRAKQAAAAGYSG